MNAKGTRFLAVLAVMAVAFAAFAAIDFAEGTSTVDGKYLNFNDGTNDIQPIVEDGTTLVAGKAYYADRNVTVTAPSSGAAIVFLVDGAKLTINGASSGSAIVGVYSASKITTTSGSTSTSAYPSGTIFVKNGVKATCLTDKVFAVPTITDDIKTIADLDVPVDAGNTVEVLSGTVKIEANANVNVTAGWTLKANVLFMASPVSINLPAGAVYEGTVTCDESFDEDESTVKLKLVSSGTSAITSGSITLTGSYGADELASEIAAADGDVILNNVTITEGKLTINSENIQINNGLTVAADATLNVEKQFESVAGVIQNEGTIDKGTGVDLSIYIVQGAGTIVNTQDPADMKNQYVSGEATQDTIYPANQVLIVDGSWTIVSGAQIVVKGQLDVPAGTVLNIEENAQLILTNAAIANIDGALVIHDVDETAVQGSFLIESGTVNVGGLVTVAGLFLLTNEDQPYGNVNILEDGLIGVDTTGTLQATGEDAAKSNLTIEQDGSLAVYGAIGIETIYNSGNVLINSLEPAVGNSQIYQRSNDAYVGIEAYTVKTTNADGEGLYTLTITDSGLVFYENAAGTVTKKVDGVFSGINQLVIAPQNAAEGAAGFSVTVSGITVVESVTATSTTLADDDGPVYNKKYYTNTMEIMGEVAVASYNDNGDDKTYPLRVTLTADRAAEVPVLMDLELGLNVELVNAATSKLTVYGFLDASALTTDSGRAVFTNNGTVTVSGVGLITKHSSAINTAGGAVVNAVEYIEKISTTSYYNYVSFDMAIALVNEDESITKLKALGSTSATVSGVLPDGVTLDVIGTVTIGSTTNRDITLTIADMASVKGAGMIVVDASMYAEDQSVVKVPAANIKSDVKTTQVDSRGKEIKNGWALWTNIYTALAAAQPGDTVKITSTDEYVRLTSSVEIKDGVTLKVPGPAKLWLADGVTLTVNGILVSEEDIFAETKFDVTAKYLADEKSSAILANGVMDLAKVPSYSLGLPAPGADDDAALTDGAPIAGAYYKIEDRNIISNLEIAMLSTDDIDTPITVNGTVAVSGIYFEAGDNCSELVIGDSIAATIPTVLNADLIVLDGSKITSTSTGATAGTLNAAIEVDDSKITVKGLSAGAATGYTISDSKDKLVLAGAIGLGDTGDSITINEGTAYTGTNLVATGNAIKVASGASLQADTAGANIAKLTVDGILYIPNAKALTVTTLTNNGMVIIEPTTSTSTAGTLNIVDEFFIGLTKSTYYSAATAAVSGAFNVSNTGKVVVLEGSVFDDAAEETLAAMNSLTYVVEGKTWIVAYAPATSTATLKVNKAPLENSELLSWNTKADGTGTARGLNYEWTVGTSNDKVLYAIVDYSIYGVTIITDNGIKSVAIDGVQLEAEGAYGKNVYSTIYDLEAGVHTVSFTYESGYTGTVNLYTYPDGTILKDYKFTLSGDRHWTTLQLSGTEQAIEPTPEPEPIPEEKEWTITTILLLVLVILIAVMAVIVALRLNRN